MKSPLDFSYALRDLGPNSSGDAAAGGGRRPLVARPDHHRAGAAQASSTSLFSPFSNVVEQILYDLVLGSDGGANGGRGALDGGLAKSLLSKRIDEKLILKHWDDIQRVVGSLKLGWVTASLFVSRLEARPRKSGLARAIQEYGRLQKTLFLLRYAESEDLRRRIGRQLNKGEDLHALRRFLFFAGEGKMRRRDPEEQGDRRSARTSSPTPSSPGTRSTTGRFSTSSPAKATPSGTRTSPTFGPPATLT